MKKLIFWYVLILTLIPYVAFTIISEWTGFIQKVIDSNLNKLEKWAYRKEKESKTNKAIEDSIKRKNN